MILVKCTNTDKVIEKGKPCIVLSGKLVRPTGDSSGDYEIVTWYNSPVDELQVLPSKDKSIGLFRFPDAVVPSLIIGDWRVHKIWDGPVLFLFCIYETEIDVSSLIGNIFSVKES
jgi:hypothetical protein